MLFHAPVRIALLALFFLPSLLPGAQKVGEVIALSGSASAQSEDGKKRELALKSEIRLNDKVVTDKGSKLQIMFEDDSLVSQGEGSEMVIDEYVFNPKAKQASGSSLRMAQGVFRVITGKITELNPERFKVKTRMATIGIRGCELGFRLQRDRENIYVFELPDGHRVSVERDGGQSDEEREHVERILVISRAGMAVLIQPGLPLRERAIQLVEHQRIIEDSTPVPAGADDPESGDAGGGGSAGSLPLVREGFESALVTGMQAENKTVLTPKVNPSALPLLPVSTSEPTTVPEPTYPPPDDAGPPIMVGGHPELDDWEWGIWESGEVTYDGNRYLGASLLTAAEFETVSAGGQLFHLAGGGMAGAVINDMVEGSIKTVEGGCSLEIEVGQSVTPRWGGSFSLGNMDGDALDFSVDFGSGGGTIDSAGKLGLGALNSYALTVHGRSYGEGTLGARSISGNLIRPASGDPAVSGAAGEFGFTHAGEVQVNGAFGANLAPVP